MNQSTAARIPVVRYAYLLGLLMLCGDFGCALAARTLYHRKTAAPDRDAASPSGVETKNLVAADETSLARSDHEYVNYQNNASSKAPTGRRIVIYTANFRIVVKEIEASIKRTESLAIDFGGWVQEIRGDRISIRVPVAKYQEVVKHIESLGRVAHRELQAADVTEEYIDLEARLKNAVAVRARLKALLEKAEDVKAAVEVEKELKRIGEEIERLQAKLELMKNRIAYSTISVTFERIYRTAPPTQLMKLPFRWLSELDPNRLTQSY